MLRQSATGPWLRPSWKLGGGAWDQTTSLLRFRQKARCRTMAERIVRARVLLMEREA